MSRRLVLHIGAPKSGTTYLQSRLVRNAGALASHGTLVPLLPHEEGPGSWAFRAALDLTGKRMGRPREYAEGYWRRLVETVTSYAGDEVVSHEAFVRCDAAAVGRAVSELGAGGHEVHVVYTARDLGRQLVSAWLEGLKHGTTHDLAEHLERARAGSLPVLRGFDLPGVLAIWLSAVPPERVHVVTLPPAGGDSSLLWTRFCVAAGIDPAWAPEDAATTNDAVGVPEAQLLLALNRALGEDSARGGRHHAIVSGPVARALGGRGSTRVALDPDQAGWIGDRAAEWIGWTAASGVDVVGDLDDLRLAPTDPTAYVDPAVPHADVAETAARVVRALLEER